MTNARVGHALNFVLFEEVDNVRSLETGASVFHRVWTQTHGGCLYLSQWEKKSSSLLPASRRAIQDEMMLAVMKVHRILTKEVSFSPV